MDNILSDAKKICQEINGKEILQEKLCEKFPGIQDSKFKDLEEEFSIKISEDVKTVYKSFNGFNLSWKYVNQELEKQNNFVEGYSKVLPFHKMFMGFDGRFWQNELWNTNTPETELLFLKRLKIFDYFGQDSVLCVCLEVTDQSILSSKLWLYRQGDKPLPMKLEIKEYFMKMQLTKGIWGWQYFYLDHRRLSPEFKAAKSNLEFILKYYPTIFSDNAITEMKANYQKIMEAFL